MLSMIGKLVKIIRANEIDVVTSWDRQFNMLPTKTDCVGFTERMKADLLLLEKDHHNLEIVVMTFVHQIHTNTRIHAVCYLH